MLIIGIGIPNVFASDIASLNPTGHGNMILTPTPSLAPTPTPTDNNPIISLSEPLDSPEEIPLNTTKPTIQQNNPSNTNTDIRSMLVNYSISDTVKVDEDNDDLTITILQDEDTEHTEEETEPEETEEAGEEEEEDDEDDNDNGNGDDNGKGNDKGKGNGKDK
jgi:hypothetical protein